MGKRRPIFGRAQVFWGMELRFAASFRTILHVWQHPRSEITTQKIPGGSGREVKNAGMPGEQGAAEPQRQRRVARVPVAERAFVEHPPPGELKILV